MTSPPQKKSSIENANNLLDELLKLSEELNEPLNYIASINDLEKMKLSAKLMTKIEAYGKAWTLAMRGDFSLVDQIYHPEYRSLDLRTGIETISRMIKL